MNTKAPPSMIRELVFEVLKQGVVFENKNIDYTDMGFDILNQDLASVLTKIADFFVEIKNQKGADYLYTK